MGADGSVLMSWIELAADSVHALRFATLEGDVWSEPRLIARGCDWFVNWADFPSLVPLGGDRLAAHWLQRDPGAAHGYALRRAHRAVAPMAARPGATRSCRTAMASGRARVRVDVRRGGDSVGAVWLDGRKSDPGLGADRRR